MESSIESNRSLNPWGTKENLSESVLNEMYDNTIDAGAKGKILKTAYFRGIKLRRDYNI